MTSNKLMLCSDKTELLVLNACHRPRPPLKSVTVDRDVIYASHAAKNIGVWFDEFLSMDKQVRAVCKSALFHPRNIAKIRKYLSFTYGVHYYSKHFEHIFDFLTPFSRPGGQILLSGITT